MPDLRITIDDIELEASWVDRNPDTRALIMDNLPVEGDASRWGDELYFRTPIDAPPENTQIEVPVGGVTYWPQGNALCVFWGPTPASKNDEPRAAAPVNLVARVDDVEPLHEVEGGAHLRFELR